MIAKSSNAAAARATHSTGLDISTSASAPSRRRCPAPATLAAHDPSFIETLSHKKPERCVLFVEGCRAPGCPPCPTRNPGSGGFQSNTKRRTPAPLLIRAARKVCVLTPRISTKAAIATVTAVAIVICLTGCGRGGPSKLDRVEHCLRVDTVERYLGQANGDCSNTALQAVGRSYQVHVSCVHQNGNVYVCEDRTYDPIDGQRTQQMYQVTYDGHSLVAQPTG